MRNHILIKYSIWTKNLKHNNVICMEERDESQESQCPTHAKKTFILQKNFFLNRKMMTSQIESSIA